MKILAPAFRKLTGVSVGLGFLCGLLAPRLAYAQDAKLRIDHLEKLADKAAEVVDVTLDGQLLRLASRFLSDEKWSSEEAKAKQLVKQLKGIYVKSFHFDHSGEYSEADVELIRSQLRPPAWVRIVGVRSRRHGDNAEVYIRTQGENNVAGLAIISAEPKELTVVNIVGPIDLDKLSELGGHLGIPPLETDRARKSGEEGGDHDRPK